MAINFPISPSLNQIYSYNGLSWQWNGSYWQSFPPSSGATGVVRTLTASTGLSANTTTGDITILFTGSTGSVFTGGTIFQSGLTSSTIYTSSKVSVGSLPQTLSAIIEVASTTQGILFPRMTNTQRESIINPTPGLFVFCTDFPDGLFMYKSTGWVQIM